MSDLQQLGLIVVAYFGTTLWSRPTSLPSLTERFFNGVANLVADKVFGGPAGAAQAPAGATEPASSGTTASAAMRGSDGANVPVVGAGGPGAADKVEANATGGPVVEAVRPVVEATSTRDRGTR